MTEVRLTVSRVSLLFVPLYCGRKRQSRDAAIVIISNLAKTLHGNGDNPNLNPNMDPNLNPNLNPIPMLNILTSHRSLQVEADL